MAYVVEATCESASLGVRVTVTAPAFVHSLAVPLIAVTGAVRSIFTAGLTALRVLPARSVTEALAVSPPPSPVSTASPGTVAGSTPERASAAVQRTVTSSLYQPLAFATVVTAPDRL